MRQTSKNNGPIAPWKDRVLEQRRYQAEERNLLYRALSPEQRIAKLDKYDHRALKERAKLQKLVENAKTEKKTSKK